MTDAEVVDRRQTARGELVLRRRAGVFEIISNGVFLMDSHDGRSERLLASAALDAAESPRSVLVGGLGVGFTLREALADPRPRRVVVAEVEPALVAWHHSHLAGCSAGALADPRVELVMRDVVELLREDATAYDVICLDVDNGPDWTVTESNAALYSDEGTALVVSRLRPGGALSVWGAAPAPAYDAILRRHLQDVRTLSVDVDVDRGDPDVVWVGRRPPG